MNELYQRVPINEQSLVRVFHKRFGVAINDKPTIVEDSIRMLRVRLITEEYKELMKSLGVIVDVVVNQETKKVSLVDLADAMGDTDYVVKGTAVSYGIDMEPIFVEIHRSNMSKGDPEPIMRADGKILKAKNFQPPNLGPILEAQMRVDEDGS